MAAGPEDSPGSETDVRIVSKQAGGEGGMMKALLALAVSGVVLVVWLFLFTKVDAIRQFTGQNAT